MIDQERKSASRAAHAAKNPGADVLRGGKVSRMIQVFFFVFGHLLLLSSLFMGCVPSSIVVKQYICLLPCWQVRRGPVLEVSPRAYRGFHDNAAADWAMAALAHAAHAARAAAGLGDSDSSEGAAPTTTASTVRPPPFFLAVSPNFQ
jgi:hypothetical protein